MEPHMEKKAWKHFRGDIVLIAVTKQWLREGRPGSSWAYVWGELFSEIREDQEMIDIALRWLRVRARRDSAAWVYVWTMLWDNGCAFEHLTSLGRAWLQEFEAPGHERSRGVSDRLRSAGFQ
jgi:hypothetical protein